MSEVVISKSYQKSSKGFFDKFGIGVGLGYSLTIDGDLRPSINVGIFYNIF
jgi:hypothetical protein